MARRRWIADEIVSEDRAALTGEHATHLARVLRARVGQEFDIAVGSEVRRGVVTAVAEDRVEFDLFEAVTVAGELKLVLAIAVFKFDRMEWAIEKATELGVARIQPVIARRTDTHLATAAAKRVERWRRIAVEAAEQSRRTAAPEVADPMRCKEFLAAKPQTPSCRRILLNETEQRVPLAEALSGPLEGETMLAIGPEGGWAEEEISAFVQAGWTSATLGPTILRAETAAIAALAVAASCLQTPRTRLP